MTSIAGNGRRKLHPVNLSPAAQKPLTQLLTQIDKDKRNHDIRWSLIGGSMTFLAAASAIAHVHYRERISAHALSKVYAEGLEAGRQKGVTATNLGCAQTVQASFNNFMAVITNPSKILMQAPELMPGQNATVCGQTPRRQFHDNKLVKTTREPK